jgi:ABC-type multidrug transport system fused ATPase/permease subunit
MENSMSLPRIYAGRRRQLLWRLVAIGVAQALVAFSLAHILRATLKRATQGVIDGPLLVAMAASGIAILALRALEAGDAERLGQDYVMRVRLRLFHRLAVRPAGTSRGGRYGLTMSRMITDLNALRNWVSVGVARSTVASITIAGLVAALVSFDLMTGAVVGGTLLLSLLLAAVITPTLRDRVREARRRRGRLANNIGEKVLALQTVRHFGRTRRELRRVRTQSRRLRDALIRRARVSQVLRALPIALQPLAISAAIAVAAIEGVEASRLVVQVLLIGMLASALGELVRAWDYRLSFEEGRRRIDQLLSGPRLAEARHAVDAPGEGPVSISLEGIGCDGLPGTIDLEAEPGEVVLVTGPGGSGKSLVLALASRQCDPERGEVRLAGVPIQSIKLDAVHETVQLVSPDVPLLRGTVAENVAYGFTGEDEDWLDSVTEACGLNDETAALPEGLATPVDEQGRNLSAGLRARIALARAAAVAPRLLCVDEPAFSFDASARDALERVVALLGSTVLVVGRSEDPPISLDRIWDLGRDPSSSNGCIALGELRTVEL